MISSVTLLPSALHDPRLEKSAAERGIRGYVKSPRCSEVTQVGALALAQLYSVTPIIGAAVWIPMAPTAFHTTAVVAGAIGTAELLLAAIGSALIAPQFGKIPPRTATLLGSATIMLACVFSGLFDCGIRVFISLRAIEGLAMGVCIGVTSTRAAVTRDPTRTFAVIQLAQSAIGSLLFVLAAMMIARFGFRGLFDLIALSWLVALPPILLIAKPAALPGNMAIEPRSAMGSREAKMVPAYIGIFLLYICYNAAFMLTGLFAGGIDLPMSTVASVLSQGSMCAAVASIAASVVGRHVPDRWSLITGGLGIVVAVAAIGLSRHLSGFTLAVCTLNVFFFACTPRIFAMVSNVDGSAHAAASSQAAAILGLAVAPAIGSFVAEALSLTCLAMFASGCAALGVSLIAGATLRLSNKPA
jgi:hypothetical protein